MLKNDIYDSLWNQMKNIRNNFYQFMEIKKSINERFIQNKKFVCFLGNSFKYPLIAFHFSKLGPKSKWGYLFLSELFSLNFKNAYIQLEKWK